MSTEPRGAFEPCSEVSPGTRCLPTLAAAQDLRGAPRKTVTWNVIVREPCSSSPHTRPRFQCPGTLTAPSGEASRVLQSATQHFLGLTLSTSLLSSSPQEWDRRGLRALGRLLIPERTACLKIWLGRLCLCACLCVCLCTGVFVRVPAATSVCVGKCLCARLSAHLCVCVWSAHGACLRACLYVSLWGVYVHICVCMCLQAILQSRCPDEPRED